MLFFTGLDTEMWTALWTFLNPSPETIFSVRSAVKEEEGRSRYPGAGRKPTLSLEDELLLHVDAPSFRTNEKRFSVSIWRL